MLSCFGFCLIMEQYKYIHDHWSASCRLCIVKRHEFHSSMSQDGGVNYFWVWRWLNNIFFKFYHPHLPSCWAPIHIWDGVGWINCFLGVWKLLTLCPRATILQTYVFLECEIFWLCVGELRYCMHHDWVTIIIVSFGNIYNILEGCYIAVIISRKYSNSFHLGDFDHNLVVRLNPQ